MKILIAEDDPLIRRALRDMLEFQGITLLFAASKREGLAMLSKEPDLVFSDLSLLEGDGLELIAAIRADAELEALPIVVLSTPSGKADLRRAMEIGADDFVMKPLQSSELMKAIKTQLSRLRPFPEGLDLFKNQEAPVSSPPLSAEVIEHLKQIQGGADLLLHRGEPLPPRELQGIAARIKMRAQILEGIIHQWLMRAQPEPVASSTRPGEAKPNRPCEGARFAENAC